MVPALLGLGAAVCFAAATWLGSVATRRGGVARAYLWLFLAGWAAACPFGVIALAGARVPLVGWAWSIAASLAASSGFAMLYTALRSGELSVVGPIIGGQGAVAVVLGAAGGDRPTWVQWVGVVLVLAGGTAVALGQSPGRREGRIRASPIVLSVLASCLFGVELWASAHAGTYIPAVSQVLIMRTTGVLFIIVALAASPGQSLASSFRMLLAAGAAAGIVDTLGLVIYVFAAARYGVTFIAPVASQSGALTVLAGVILLQEPPTFQKIFGAAVMGCGLGILYLPWR